MKTAPLIGDNVHEICTFSTKASNNAQTRVKIYFHFFYLTICVDSLESALHRRMVQISRYQRHLLLKLSFVFSIGKVYKRNHGGGPVRSPGIFVCSLKNILSDAILLCYNRLNARWLCPVNHHPTLNRFLLDLNKLYFRLVFFSLFTTSSHFLAGF